MPAIFTRGTARSICCSEVDFLKRSIDICPISAYIIDTDNKFIHTNEALCNALGYSREEMRGMFVRTVNSRVTDDRLEALWSSLRRTSAAFYESECCRKDGTRYPIESRLRYIPLDGREYCLGFAINISQCQKSKLALLESEERYRRLLSSISGYVYTVEIKQGKCASTRHGEGSFAVTGYRPEEYAQDQDLWINMILEEDRPKVLQAIDSLLADKSSVSLEHRIKRKDGAIRWLSATLVPRIDRNGQLIFYDGLISDITSRKETERLDERHQQQLLLMDKMASLGILVSGVAHEINNPNNYMMLNAKILSKAWNEVLPVLDSHFAGQSQASMAGLPYEEARTLLPGIMKGMLDGTNRIKHIVDSLRSYSREDTSQLRQNVDLNRAVESALTLVSSLVRKTTDFLEVRCDNSLPTIKGSQQQIEQVIINLLTNACHALRNRSDRIEVRTSSDECAIILQVIDTGVGIAEGDILKITEPFFTTRRDLGGTGLGLSVSSNIIKNHGGTIAFASELGKGTTVTVRLPREQK